MIKYNVTTDKNECLECRTLFKQYFPKAFLETKYVKIYSIAKDGDKIVGCIGMKLSKEPGIIVVHYMFIHPDYRNKNIRPKMFKEAIKHFKKDKKIYLMRTYSVPDKFKQNMIKNHKFNENNLVGLGTIELYVGGK